MTVTIVSDQRSSYDSANQGVPLDGRRRHRQVPERTEPIRNWQAAFHPAKQRPRYNHGDGLEPPAFDRGADQEPDRYVKDVAQGVAEEPTGGSQAEASSAGSIRDDFHWASFQETEERQSFDGDFDRDRAEPSTATSDWRDTVYQSVRMGYRVIEDHIRHGQSCAQGINGGGNRAEAASFDPWGEARRQLEKLSTLWLDLLLHALRQPTSFAGGSTGAVGEERRGAGYRDHRWTADPFSHGERRWSWEERPSSSRGAEQDSWSEPSPRSERGTDLPRDWPARGDSSASPRAAPGNEPIGVAIDVTSSRPTRIEFHLRPEAVGRMLEVTSLESATAGNPPLTDVVCLPSPEPLHLRVTVSDEQPEGLYAGDVTLYETGVKCGELRVRVGDLGAG